MFNRLGDSAQSRLGIVCIGPGLFVEINQLRWFLHTVLQFMYPHMNNHPNSIYMHYT